MKPDDKAPNKKYFRPAEVADSESRYNVASIYTAKLCSSIAKYIETRSALETNNVAPVVVKRIIKENSETVGEIDMRASHAPISLDFPFIVPITRFAEGVFFSILGNKEKDLDTGINIIAPTKNMNASILWDTVVTLNRPLYKPRPEPIWLINSPLYDNAAENSRIIVVIRVNIWAVNLADESDIASNSVINPIRSIT